MSKPSLNTKKSSSLQVEIISIGDELLLGQTVNTNATWMGEQLGQIGAGVARCTVVQDEYGDLMGIFKDAINRSDVVLVTGGLGPTKDDITKRVLCDYFNTELVLNQEVLSHVEQIFKTRNREMLDVNYDQALLPANCEPLYNTHGTAPGMWFETDEDKVLVSMPGVPYEMKFVMSEHVLPRLTKKYEFTSLHYETLHTQGIGETNIAVRIADLESEMRSTGIGLAYLPSPGMVRLRLSATPTKENISRIEGYLTEIESRLQKYVFARDKKRLEQVVGELLLQKGYSLGTIESCTGGALAAAIVSVAGSSRYFAGSVVSYSNNIKADVVGVKKETLEEFGAVSEEVVVEMATNGKEMLGVDYCVALSGIAGPEGGSEEKPVGTVWIAVAGPYRVFRKKFQFEVNRERNIRRSVLTALNLVRCELLEINIEKK